MKTPFLDAATPQLKRAVAEYLLKCWNTQVKNGNPHNEKRLDAMPKGKQQRTDYLLRELRASAESGDRFNGQMLEMMEFLAMEKTKANTEDYE